VLELLLSTCLVFINNSAPICLLALLVTQYSSRILSFDKKIVVRLPPDIFKKGIWLRIRLKSVVNKPMVAAIAALENLGAVAQQ